MTTKIQICCERLKELHDDHADSWSDSDAYITSNSSWEDGIVLQFPVVLGGDECVPNTYKVDFCPFCGKKLKYE